MKHIKPFNENHSRSRSRFKNKIEQQELKNFCETHLAYLLDDDNFELKVDTFQIRLENNNGFKWNDIKDYFIPFLVHFDKIWGDRIYIGKQLFIHNKFSGWEKVHFDYLVNDELRGELHYVWDKIHIELIDL